MKIFGTSNKNWFFRELLYGPFYITHWYQDVTIHFISVLLSAVFDSNFNRKQIK